LQTIAKKALPGYIKENLIAYVACLAGAVTEEEYRTFLADACFNGGSLRISIERQRNDFCNAG
jgi:hypothetical protein